MMNICFTCPISEAELNLALIMLKIYLQSFLIAMGFMAVALVFAGLFAWRRRRKEAQLERELQAIRDRLKASLCK